METKKIEINKECYIMNNKYFPRVTRIISYCEDIENQFWYKKWVDKVGEKEANNIKNHSAQRGRIIHGLLEHYQDKQKLKNLLTQSSLEEKMFFKNYESFLKTFNFLKHEQKVSYQKNNLLYAGTLDFYGKFQNENSITIGDFKNVNKKKYPSQCIKYALQLGAYAKAIEEKVDITKGIIVISTKENLDIFEVKEEDLLFYKDAFLVCTDYFMKQKKFNWSNFLKNAPKPKKRKNVSNKKLST
jgi:hypothetical protein